ncbi:MAG: hypothetical protein AB7H77_03685 [Bdellovibrionales bacterium]
MNDNIDPDSGPGLFSEWAKDDVVFSSYAASLTDVTVEARPARNEKRYALNVNADDRALTLTVTGVSDPTPQTRLPYDAVQLFASYGAAETGAGRKDPVLSLSGPCAEFDIQRAFRHSGMSLVSITTEERPDPGKMASALAVFIRQTCG